MGKISHRDTRFPAAVSMDAQDAVGHVAVVKQTVQ